MFLPKPGAFFVSVHTVKKGDNKLRSRKALIFEGKELGAMDRKPARFACMAVGHGKQNLLRVGDVLPCLEKDRIGTALGQVQVTIKGHNTALRAIGIRPKECLTLGSGLLGTGLVDANDVYRAVAFLKNDQRSQGCPLGDLQNGVSRKEPGELSRLVH